MPRWGEIVKPNVSLCKAKLTAGQLDSGAAFRASIKYRESALSGIAFILMGALFTGSAQTPPPQGSQAAPPQTQTFTADQLTDLVAPIPLYPDGLLSHVLVASTYPLEVVEAHQSLHANPTLTPTPPTHPTNHPPRP